MSKSTKQEKVAPENRTAVGMQFFANSKLDGYEPSGVVAKKLVQKAIRSPENIDALREDVINHMGGSNGKSGR